MNHAGPRWFVPGDLDGFGVIHEYRLKPQGVENSLGWWVASDFTLSYLAAAVFLLLCHWYAQCHPDAFAK